MNTMVSRTLSVHKGYEMLLKLEAAGFDNKLAQKFIDPKCNDLATKVVRLIENDGFEPSTSQKRARKIMGQNFFGIEEAIKHFGIKPSKAQIAALSKIPFTKKVLKFCKDTHILVAVFPKSILDIRDEYGGKFHPRENFWYNEEFFAKDRGEIGWYLVCKTPVADSGFTGDEVQLLRTQSEKTPSAQILAYTIIGHYRNIGELLFDEVSVHTSSLARRGTCHVGIGKFNPRWGLDIRYKWIDFRRASFFDASSVRKT